MEKIYYILEEDEEILGEYIEITNLTKFSTVFNIFLGLLAILFPSFLLFINILTSMDLLIHLIIGEFSLIVGLFLSIIKSRFDLPNAFQMPLRELKEYKNIFAITNQRLIQKNYNEAIRTERKITKYQINCVNIAFDLIILNIDDISEIRFDTYNKAIYFHSNEFHRYVYRFNFRKFKELTKYRIPEMEKAIEILQETEQVLLDRTYSGKTFACLLDEVRKHRCDNKVVLFWNTFCSDDFAESIKTEDYKKLPAMLRTYF